MLTLAHSSHCITALFIKIIFASGLYFVIIKVHSEKNKQIITRCN